MTDIANCTECLTALARTKCDAPFGRHERVVPWENKASRSGPRSTAALVKDKRDVVLVRHRWCATCRTGHVLNGDHELELQIEATKRFGNPNDSLPSPLSEGPTP